MHRRDGVLFQFDNPYPQEKKSGRQDCFIFNLCDKDSLGVYSGEGTPGTAGCRDKESTILLLRGSQSSKGLRHVKQLDAK